MQEPRNDFEPLLDDGFVALREAGKRDCQSSLLDGDRAKLDEDK
jgi:hypothetical protein